MAMIGPWWADEILSQVNVFFIYASLEHQSHVAVNEFTLEMNWLCPW